MWLCLYTCRALSEGKVDHEEPKCSQQLVCICVHVHVCVRVSSCVSVCLCLYLWVCTCAYVYPCVCLYMHAYTEHTEDETSSKRLTVWGPGFKSQS